jgi:hypothetical protein
MNEDLTDSAAMTCEACSKELKKSACKSLDWPVDGFVDSTWQAIIQTIYGKIMTSISTHGIEILTPIIGFKYTMLRRSRAANISMMDLAATAAFSAA